MQQHFSCYLPEQGTERLHVSVSHPSKTAQGLVFVLHGLAGHTDESFLSAVRHVFANRDFTVVAIDARYGFGLGEGDLEKACFSTFIQDLNTVVSWAKTQPFYQHPFYLCGHSLGGGACLHYALNNPDDTAALVTLSAVFNGRLLMESYQKHKPDFFNRWKQEKFISRERNDIIKKQGKISFDHLTDALTYALDEQAPALKAPLLMICGERDISSDKHMNMTFFNKVNAIKELACLPNANHTYTQPGNIDHLCGVLDNWLAQITVL